MSTFGLNPTYFPAQKKLEKEKNDKWFKECVDIGVGISQWGQNNVRSSNVRSTRRNKIINSNSLCRNIFKTCFFSSNYCLINYIVF